MRLLYYYGSYVSINQQNRIGGKMSGSVYPCEKCKVQNWVVDINEEGVCIKCAKEADILAELAIDTYLADIMGE